KEESAPSAERPVDNKPPKPILLIAVVVVNLLVMCAVVAILWTSFKREQAKPKIDDVVQGEVEDQEKRADAAENEDYIDKLVPMETFVVNLAGSRGNKLVKINMEFEVDGPKLQE